jgi:hypothetical protein
MNKKYLFVFSNTPDGPSVLQGFFPLELENEAKEFHLKGGGYRTMMIGDWNGFGEVPDRDKLAPYTPQKGFYPFKVIGSKKSGFSVFLQGKNSFGDYYLYEGNFEDCQKECDHLNKMIQAHVDEYLKDNP